MRLVVTGGGTGGHIYPALEVARLAREGGAELLYLGSLRGQEGEACRRADVPFEGFPSEPLYSLKTPRGWRAMGKLVRATASAKRTLRRARPDVVFSTGGYGAAPVMSAARSLRIPYAIHEANSVPGRSNRLFAPRAAGVTCTFRTTTRHFARAVRTGQPIRRELRAAAQEAEGGRTILALGGSQGSVFLNDLVCRTADVAPDLPFLLATGRANSLASVPPNLDARPYLETPEVTAAYRSAGVFVGRSGGTLAELALFRLPSVLVPLPTSADDHQLRNAEEFVSMGAATLLEQGAATPEALRDALLAWTSDPRRIAQARAALAEWDVPDATERILKIVEAAATP